MNIRPYILATLLVVGGNPESAIAQDGGRWLPATNPPHCKMWDPAGQPEKTFAWHGKCDKDGRVAGHGMIEWRWNGYIHGLVEISPGNGLALEGGKVVVRLPDTGINISQEGCGVVKIAVPRTLAVAYDLVTHEILTNAAKSAKAKCPNSSVNVCINYHNEEPDLRRIPWWTQCEISWQWDRSRPRMEFDGYKNKPKGKAADVVQQIRMEEIAKEKEQRYAAQANQKDAEKAKAAATRAAFMKRYGATQIVLGDDLRANPFRFQGQTVVVLQHFSSMIGPQRAVMTHIVVDGVPSTLFKGNEQILLAVKVLGTVALDTPVRPVKVPHGQYIGSVVCHEIGCADYGMTK